MRMRLGVALGTALLVGLGATQPARAQGTISPTEQAPVTATEQAPVTPTAKAAADPAELGQVGESCRARSDCRPNLRCVEQVCRSIHQGAPCQADTGCPDQLICLQQRCTPRYAAAAATTQAPQAAAAPAATASAAAPAPDPEIRLRGTHLFVGLSAGGGMTYWKANNIQFPPDATGTPEPVDLDTTKASVMIANFHLGVMFDQLALSIEIAPVTWMPIVSTGSNSRDPILSALFNVGYFLHVKDDFYWPLHAGVGFVAVNTDRLGDPKFQARLQPIGIAYHYGSFLFEADIPEVRYATEFSDTTLLSLVFTLRALYLF